MTRNEVLVNSREALTKLEFKIMMNEFRYVVLDYLRRDPKPILLNLDNFPAHDTQVIEEALGDLPVTVLFSIPRCSFLNFIEMTYAYMKSSLRT